MLSLIINSAVEQISGSKETLYLEQDYYDDIDNFNDHININNRENTTKIKKYSTKVKKIPSYVLDDTNPDNQSDLVVLNRRPFDNNAEHEPVEDGVAQNDIPLNVSAEVDSDSTSDNESTRYYKRKVISTDEVILDKRQKIQIEKSDGNFIFIT